MLKQLSAGTTSAIIAAMREHFGPADLEKGWRDYHRGRVNVVSAANKKVYAAVREADLYLVTLRLDRFADSECTCPDGGFCKHMAAVCFAVYADYGRPELLLQELTYDLLHRQKKTETTKTKTKTDKPFTARKPGPSPQEWHAYFDRQFYGYAITNQYAVEHFYSVSWEQLSALAEGENPGERSFFLLHVLLFILRKLDQLYAHNATTYFSYYVETGCRIVASRAMERLEQIIGVRSGEFSGPPSAIPSSHLDETSEVLRRFVFSGDQSVIPKLDVFRLLWSAWLNEPERIDNETARLEAELDAYPESSYGRTARIAALAHFHVMKGDDEAAFRLASREKLRDVPLFIWYLRHFRQTEQWDRLHRWLKWLLPSLRQASQEHLRIICGYWIEIAARQSSDEEWVQVMKSLLPLSYSYYSDYLMHTGRHRQWIDLQLAHHMMPANLYSEHLKKVEDDDPELLLPLYHQSVERYILEKNRPSYQDAVRLLRKLAHCYEKLGQRNQWDEFIRLLSEKYSRLRAFQEELKRGKLIP